MTSRHNLIRFIAVVVSILLILPATGYTLPSQAMSAKVTTLSGDMGSGQSQSSSQASSMSGENTGTFIVKVINDNGGTLQPKDFTIKIKGSGGGTPNPSSFPGSESGTEVTFSGGGYFDLGINEEPGYTRSLGSDCPAAEIPSTFTCTITFDDAEIQGAPQTLTKQHAGQEGPVGTFIVKVINDNGGKLKASDFTIKIIGSGGGTPNPSSFPGSESGTDVVLSGGGHFELGANEEPGYTRSLGSDCPTAEIPATFTCTITFDDVTSTAQQPPPTIQPQQIEFSTGHIIVKVINDNGRTLQPEDFTINIQSLVGTATPNSFPGEGEPGTAVKFTHPPGQYAKFGAGPNNEPGYDRTFGPDCPPGDYPPTFTCTITFDDIPPPSSAIGKTIKGKFIVNVINNHGGTAKPSDVKIDLEPIKGSVSPLSFLGSSSGTEVTVTPSDDGSAYFKYGVSAFRGGYDFNFGPDCPTSKIEDGFTCTITFEDIPSLKVIKNVTNDNGRTKEAGDFTIRVTGDSLFKVGDNPFSDIASFQGNSAGTEVRFAKSGSYNVSEITHNPDYDTTLSPQCVGTVTAKTNPPPVCTITNNDKKTDKGTITVLKYLINDNGGTKEPWDFTIHVKGTNAAPADFKPSQKDVVPPTEYSGYSRVTSTVVKVDPGQYNVTEDSDPHYDSVIAGFTPCHGQIKSGEELPCVFFNDDKPGFVNVIKRVINNNSGTKQPTDFRIQATGNHPMPSSFNGSSSGTAVQLNAGSYSITEMADPGYKKVTYSDGCAGAISLGENRTCVITNDDNEPATTTTTNTTGTLIVIKKVVNDNGGAMQASDFTIKVDGNNPYPNLFMGSTFPGTEVKLEPGQYEVLDHKEAGYQEPQWRKDCFGVINAGEVKTCTIINNDIPPSKGLAPGTFGAQSTIKVIKNVVNDNGGSKRPSDFRISVEGNNPNPREFMGSGATSSMATTQTTTTLNQEKLPVILIHGWSSNAQDWAIWEGLLKADKIPFYSITFKESDDPCGSAQDHATELAKIVDQVKKDTGKGQVNIVGYSKGGLDARVYLAGAGSGVGGSVANLIMIGTPNAGTPLASFIDYCKPGLSDLLPGSSATQAQRNMNTKYFTISGDWDPATGGNPLVDGNDDQLVAVSSVESQKYFSSLGHTSHSHDQLVGEEEYGLARQVLGANLPEVTSMSAGAFESGEGIVVSIGSGTYSVKEDPDPGYDKFESKDCFGTIGVGEQKICTITNNDKQFLPGKTLTAAGQNNSATLMVIKHVINDNGGTKKASDFNISMFGAEGHVTPNKFPGSEAPGTAVTLTPSETGNMVYSAGDEVLGQYGYSEKLSPDCIGGAHDQRQRINPGETKTCIITNDDNPPPSTSTFGAQSSLRVIKNVVNNNGESKQASDFTITIQGNNPSSNLLRGAPNPGTLVNIGPGQYKVDERTDPRYDKYLSPGCEGVLGRGESRVCTITNDDKRPTTGTLVVIKNVIGGIKRPSDFTIQVTGNRPSLNFFDGASSPGTAVSVGEGRYSALEITNDPRYPPTYQGDCTGTMAGGQTKTCTITNSYRPTEGGSFGAQSSLRVIKNVINDNGGIKLPSDFVISVQGNNPAPNLFSGAQYPGRLITIGSGAYKVDESPDSRYDMVLSAGCQGTLGVGESRICTITNNDKPLQGGGFGASPLGLGINGTRFAGNGTDSEPVPGKSATLRVIKNVLNDNGGTRMPSDFIISVSGNNVSQPSFAGKSAPGTLVVLDPGRYAVTEAMDRNYSTNYSPDCIGGILAGESKTCTISNDDKISGEFGAQASLIVTKNVINDDGRTSNASDFVIEVRGNKSSPNLFLGAGSPNQTIVELGPGNYSVVERQNAVYSTSYSPGCKGTVAKGESKVCLVTNDDRASGLSPNPIVVETFRFGRSQFPSNGTFVLASVSPLHLIRGHVLLNLPNNETTLVASSLNNTGIEHAVLVPLVKVPGTGKSLYHADFDGSVNGTNPFTGNQDSVSKVTDLMLRNPSQSPVNFDDQHGGTITLVLSRPDPSLNLNYSLVDIETLKLGRSEFPSNGTIVLADVFPIQILSGHVVANLPNSSVKLVAAKVNETGVEHAVIVPLRKFLDPKTGERLYQGDLLSTFNGTNPFNSKPDIVSDITDLMLWSRNPSGVQFDDDHGIALTIIAGNGNSTNTNTDRGNSNNSAAAAPTLSTSNGNIAQNSSLTTSKIEAIKFGRSQFPSNGTIVLASVSPLRITGGHVLLNLPNNDTILVAAQQLTGRGVEHAVTIPLTKFFDPRTGESLFHANLRSPISGNNPFTGRTDSLTNITDLFLRSSSSSGVSFDDDHGVTGLIVMQEGQPQQNPNPQAAGVQVSNNQTTITTTSTTTTTNAIPRLLDIETLKFGRSSFPANESILVADIEPMRLAGGRVLLNLPSNETMLVLARINDTGIQHAVVVPLNKSIETRAGDQLFYADLGKSINGTNPFTNKQDSIVEDITDLLLRNNGSKPINFDDDHGITFTPLVN